VDGQVVTLIDTPGFYDKTTFEEALKMVGEFVEEMYVSLSNISPWFELKPPL
jgi:hypothetical protein